MLHLFFRAINSFLETFFIKFPMNTIFCKFHNIYIHIELYKHRSYCICTTFDCVFYLPLLAECTWQCAKSRTLLNFMPLCIKIVTFRNTLKSMPACSKIIFYQISYQPNMNTFTVFLLIYMLNMYL